jgi:predicted transposase YbfD/YdcC
MATLLPPRIHAAFAGLPDPRIERTKRHQLADVLTIALCAVLSGADSWVEVEQYGNAKLAWLRAFLDLPNGIPSHDTFGRVFAALDPTAFETCFLDLVRAVLPDPEEGAPLAGECIAIDGKTARRSHAREAGRPALQLVSAWASDARLILGQVAVGADTNEITTIPQLLPLLDLRGSVVTLDALGCQIAISAGITARGGDYVLALKDNHASEAAVVETYFSAAEEEGWCDTQIARCETIDGEHGRIEIRRYWLSRDPDLCAYLNPTGAWSKLASVGMVQRERRVGSTTSRQTRYFLSSLPGDVARFAEAVREHWGIENTVHWVLDMAFREDESRIRQGHAAENLAILRRMALNLLRHEASAKVGVKAKRLKAAWDDDYLLRVLRGTVD